MSHPVKAMIFDADGVVIDSMRLVWIPADTEFCLRHGLVYTDDMKAHIAGTKLDEGIRDLKKYFGLQGDDQELLQDRIDTAVRYYQKGITFMEGFLDFFSRYSNLLSAVATSMDSRYLEIVERVLKISDVFRGHVYSVYNTEVRSKPHPDIFLFAAKQLGVHPSACVVFEDAPHGIEAARRAGMRSVALTTSFPRERLIGATCVVDAFDEVDMDFISSQALPQGVLY